MEKRIYTCATAHLDTIWNWDFEHTVSTCLFNTLYDNFKLFEKYPDYKFNFEGAYRYELFEEYYPEEFKKLKEYVKKGKWNVSGSAYENGDVNVPSPEALFRNILYGNEYFSKTFGKRSKDIYLPDCFGFGYALPAIIRHANLLGFTSQKLTWGSAYGTPFDIGKWYGVNGKYCFGCLKPDAYDLTYKCIRDKKDNKEKLENNEKCYGLPWTFSFHGVGDQGGAPKENSVKVLQSEIDENDKNNVKVISSKSDQIYIDLINLKKEQIDRLPLWNNELVMRDHGAGGYTSRAIGKRLNRRGEELCDMVEKTAVLGTSLGGMDYPSSILEKAWKRIIAHQFHDDLPGTSVQRAYRRSWNDYFMSLNQLENEYYHSASVIANSLDTYWTKGTPIVVNNTLEYERHSLVKFKIISTGKYFIAKDKNGKIYPVDVIERNNNEALLAFVPFMKPLSSKVFDIIETKKMPSFKKLVLASNHSLENQNFSVKFNTNGEICSCFDKKRRKELLKEPIIHQLIPYYGSIPWPAWELTHKSVFSKKYNKPTIKSIKVIYSGFTSAEIEVIQTYGNSTFKSIVSLYSHAESLSVQNEIEWWEQKTLLKDRFSLNVSNKVAKYDLGLGAIERGNNSDTLFEVPGQKWAEISENDLGVGVLSDCKYGWDKPNDNTLRLTVLHTPVRNYTVQSMQSLMDLGLNLYGYGLTSFDEISSLHKEARCFHQGFTALLTDKHKGVLKSEYSFGSISNNNVVIRAIKKAENSNEIIVRFNEISNQKCENVMFSLGKGILKAREVYASEEEIGEAKVENGNLVFDIDAYDVKTFALTLKDMTVNIPRDIYKEIKLPHNTVVYTKKSENSKPVIRDYKSLTIPKEIKPKFINYNGLKFPLDDSKGVYCDGQKLILKENFNKLCFISFTKSKDHNVNFKVNNNLIPVEIHNCCEYIGVWDLAGMENTAKIKNCDLAYEFTHSHNEYGADVIAKQLFVFYYEIDVSNANEIIFPKDNSVIILSALGVKSDNNNELLTLLYDRVKPRKYKNNMNLQNKIRSTVGRLPYNSCPTAPLHKRSDGYILK